MVTIWFPAACVIFLSWHERTELRTDQRDAFKPGRAPSLSYFSWLEMRRAGVDLGTL
jgi:hypothetical protein